MTDTPSRRPGLRDELVAALGQIDTVPPVAHRRQQADNVLTLLYREWPWLRAEAEDLAEARQHLANAYAQRDRLRIRMNALADQWEHALAPDKAYARALRAEISVAPFHAAPSPEDEAVDETPVYGCTIGGKPAIPILASEYNQLVTSLTAAEAEVRRYAEADSADAAAGSYAGRAEQAEAFIAFVADTIADHEGDEWADHSATRAIRAAIARAVEPPGPAAADGLYDKLTAMFSGPLPPPGDTPPSTVLGCSLHQLRRTHGPHRWQPQPGMRPVQCPGWEHVPAAADIPLAAAFRDCLAAFDGMRNSDNTGDIQHWQARVTPREYETWQTTARAAGPTTAGVHVYLSTGCLHGDHDYCKSMTGLNGAKRPASCKKCGAKCICSCHEQPGPA